MEERVAITLWKLATNVECTTLSALFGLGRLTVGEIVLDTSHAVVTHLLSQYVQIPKEEKLKKVLLRVLRRTGVFHNLWGLLMVHTYR